ncbi:diguanylate cyclase domain-containing protein [Parablastomonas sp. CN1-191]|uniref:GGDEF domain-containing protein n=1 Tax=Parablastomonas sp. CN1-191 TaxID=3400908 RepID=UPI003BF8104A
MTSDMLTGFTFLVAFMGLELLSALTGPSGWGAGVAVAAPVLLAACLLALPRSYWAVIAALAALAGLGIALAAGSGLSASLALALATVLQGTASAYGIARAEARFADAPARWLANLATAGVAGPALAALVLAAAARVLAGIDPVAVFAAQGSARAVGALSLLPLLRHVFRADRTWIYRPLLRAERASIGLYSAAAAALEVAATAQPQLLTALAASLAVVAASWRGGRLGAVIAVAVYAVAAWIAHAAFAPGEAAFAQFHIALTALLAQAVALLRDGRYELAANVRALQSELIAVESGRRRAQDLYTLLAASTRDIVFKTDLAGRVLYASPAVELIAGQEPAAVLGRRVSDLVDPTQAAMFENRFGIAMDECRDLEFDHLVFHKEGIEHWFDARIHCQRDDAGAAEGGVVILSGIDEKKALEAELVAAALRDPLTGLTNRATFIRLLGQHIEAGGTGCLAKFDLDHFRTVNQEHGSQVGDQLLISFANLLRSLLREGDVIARVGGERFAVMLPNATADEAERVCSRIVSEMSDIGAGTVSITASAGVSRIAGTLDETMKNADRAVVVAKAKGRNRVELEGRRSAFQRQT